MGGKQIDNDLPPPGSRGGKNDIAAPFASQEETMSNMIKDELMKTDNAFSDLVKTTEKGPKTLKEREAEVLARMNKENKETARRIRNRKMVEDAIDNMSPTFVKGDRKYNAQMVAEDLAEKRFNKEFYDLDQKQQTDIYGEALDGLDDSDKFAQGGRAGFKGGMGKGFLEFIKKFGVKQSGDDLKDFLSKRKFMKDIVGNTEKNRRARELTMLKEAMKDAKGYQFPSGEELRKDIEKVIQPILNKDRKLNSDGGRIGYADGTPSFEEYLKERGMIEKRQNLEKLMKEYQEDMRRKNVMEQKQMAADGGRIGLKAGMTKRAFLKLMGGTATGS
jgi:chorismate mutase